MDEFEDDGQKKATGSILHLLTPALTTAAEQLDFSFFVAFKQKCREDGFQISFSHARKDMEGRRGSH
jgi:hypothetical protein